MALFSGSEHKISKSGSRAQAEGLSFSTVMGNLQRSTKVRTSQ